MNGKNLSKNQIKNRQKSNNQCQNAACEQIARIFVQSPFSHSTLKLEQINSRRKKKRNKIENIAGRLSENSLDRRL